MTVPDFDISTEYERYGKSMLPQILPEGPVVLRVKKAEPRKSQKGKFGINLNLEAVSGPHQGETMFDTLWWSPENDTAVRIWNQNLTSLGASQEWIMANRPTTAQLLDHLVGATFNATIKHEEFNGAPQARVRYGSPVTTAGTPGAATLPNQSAPAQAAPAAQAPAQAPAQAAPQEQAQQAQPQQGSGFAWPTASN